MTAATKPIPTGPTIDPQTYLGASQVGAIAGLNKYATALDVWADIQGKRTVEPTTRMMIGTVKERPILEGVYAPRHGVELEYPGTLVNPSCSWQGATPDAIESGNIIVEFKSLGRGSILDWGDPLEGADGIPAATLAQVHWQAHVAGHALHRDFEMAHVVTEYGNELLRYVVPIDTDFTMALCKIAERFWTDHIIQDRMPLVEEATANAREILESIYPKVLYPHLMAIPEVVKKLADTFARNREEEKGAKAVKELMGNKLRQLIANNSGFEGDGYKVTWTEQQGRVNWRGVATELNPPEETIERHRSKPSRVLRVTVPNND